MITVTRLVELFEKHDKDGFGGSYLKEDVGCIDGYFDLEAIVKEINDALDVPQAS